MTRPCRQRHRLATRIHGRARGAGTQWSQSTALPPSSSSSPWPRSRKRGRPRTGTADRIEHAGVVPPGYAGALARLGLARSSPSRASSMTGAMTTCGTCRQRSRTGCTRAPACCAPGCQSPRAPTLRSARRTPGWRSPPPPPGAPRRCDSRCGERVSASQALRLFLAAPGISARPQRRARPAR